MQSEFWHERWQENRIGFHQGEINPYLQAFWEQIPVPPGSSIFVPLCGKSHDLLWLRARGFQVLGVELSPIAVRDFYSENKLQPVITRQGKFERWEAGGLAILLGDFFNLCAEDLAHCAGVFDRASLIALPPSMRTRYAEHFTAILLPAAPTLLVTMEYTQNEMEGPPFAVDESEVRGLYETHYTVDRLLAVEVLGENPGFRQRGATWMEEKVYHLMPRLPGGT